VSTPAIRAAILRGDYYERNLKPLVGTGKPPVVWRFKREDGDQRKKTLAKLDHAWPPTVDEIDEATGGRP